ncbi:MAG: putative transporter, NadC family [Ramlibacter sp.]|nr:putative transporter, NadC family [Ramlibacter sp.]
MTEVPARVLRVAGCVLLAALVYLSLPATDAAAAGPRVGLALFALVGGLWLTQALPLALTALLVPLLAVPAGVSDLRTALAPFAHPIIFLFLGGFALAAALQHKAWTAPWRWPCCGWRAAVAAWRSACCSRCPPSFPCGSATPPRRP